MNASVEELLSAADSGDGRGRNLARSASNAGRVYAILLAILVASFLLAIEFIVPARVLWQLIAITAFYSIGVLGLTLWYVRNRKASGLGWRKRYSRAFALTMAFYAVGLAIGTNNELSSPAFWLPYAALTAAPLVIAAIRQGAK